MLGTIQHVTQGLVYPTSYNNNKHNTYLVSFDGYVQAQAELMHVHVSVRQALLKAQVCFAYASPKNLYKKHL